MYYVMRQTEGVATRYGKMFTKPEPAIRLAQRSGGYVEHYGKGLYWPLQLDELKKRMH